MTFPVGKLSLYETLPMKILFSFFCSFFLLPSATLAQADADTTSVRFDEQYREDQFYLGFNYNILTGLSEGISSSGFSGGLYTGFIRDMPLNDQRNFSLGVGLGWSINTYGQTLFIGEDIQSGESIFLSLDEIDINYNKNRFTIQALEVPFQLRWRTSNAQSHKFWRVYTGLQFGYAYYFKSAFEQPGNDVSQTEVPEFNRWRLGATFAFGYNTFNFHVYYGLTPFFSSEAQLEGQEIDMNSLQVGLVFYIL